MSAHRQVVQTLYRSILRQHKQKLPYEQKMLADSYVAKEFRDHKTAAPVYVTGFMKAWEGYLGQITQQHTPGRDLTEDELLKLSPEQRLQLEKLKDEATKRSE